MKPGNNPAVNLKGERIWVADGKDGKAGSGIKPTNRVCILVLGAHRSGTSPLTRVVSLLGCDLSKTLIPANKTNQAGHWESPPICRLNDKILESAGTNWDDWLEFNPGWLQSPKAGEFREQALAVLQEQFGSSRLFVLKDPRICRIAPFWIGVLKEAGVQPLIISPVRNPLEAAASLKERNGFELSFGHVMWLRHVLEGEFASRGMPRFFTSYDHLMTGWSRVATEAQATLGIAWPRLSDQVAVEIDAFLSDKYRHHHEAPDSVINNPTLSKWLRDTFEILNNWTVAGEKPEDFAVLDQIKAEFNAAAPTFARLIASGQKAFGKSRALEQELTETQAKLRKADVKKRQLQARLKARFKEIAALTRMLEQDRKQAGWIKEITAKQLGSAFKAVLDHINSRLGRKANLAKRSAILRRTGPFDPDWYLQKYADVAKAGMDPLEHYLLYGADEGRAPNAVIHEALEDNAEES